MPDEYIGKREFDGFGNSVREEFKRLGENLAQVSVKIDTLVNGRVSWLSLVADWANALIGTPAIPEPVIDGLPAYACDFGPLRNTGGFISNRYNDIIPSVSSLLGGGCPPTISRLISLVAINPINRM